MDNVVSGFIACVIGLALLVGAYVTLMQGDKPGLTFVLLILGLAAAGSGWQDMFTPPKKRR